MQSRTSSPPDTVNDDYEDDDDVESSDYAHEEEDNIKQPIERRSKSVHNEPEYDNASEKFLSKKRSQNIAEESPAKKAKTEESDGTADNLSTVRIQSATAITQAAYVANIVDDFKHQKVSESLDATMKPPNPQLEQRQPTLLLDLGFKINCVDYDAADVQADAVNEEVGEDWFDIFAIRIKPLKPQEV